VSCLVRDLSSPRVGNARVGIMEDVQLPLGLGLCLVSVVRIFRRPSK